MKVLFVSHEVSPYAKVGGLADVAGSLPKALRARGHDVRVLMPGYRMVREDPRWNVQRVAEPFEVPINPVWSVEASAEETAHEDVPAYLLRVGDWFDATVSSETVYLPGEDQHIAFARASLEFCQRLGWMPDVVHTHDWHTSLLPVFMRESHREAWEDVGSVHTIHNLAYQGVFPPETTLKAGLPWDLFEMNHLETWGNFNFLKAGCVYADRTTTVSPNYAQEIQTAEFGCTLEGVMRHFAAEGRLSGILNGIDTDLFDPQKDPHLATRYSAKDLAGKAKCRSALLEEMGWKDELNVPIAGIVTRLSQQKGLDLVLAAAEELAELPMRMVVLGLGEPWIADRLEALQKEKPDRVRFFKKFDLALAQRIYSGSDLFFMPSAFEPCGLGQLIAMRYGTLPIARHTGGLADTVFEGQNGFVFDDKTPEAFLGACTRAVQTFGKPTSWKSMVKRAMGGDYGWAASAEKYEKVYDEAVRARKPARAKRSAV